MKKPIILDEFNGDNEHLRSCIEALIDLGDKGALMPTGLCGHARNLLAACFHRLKAAPEPAGDKEDIQCYCGCAATVAIMATNIPNPRWMAHCDRCAQEHHETTREVNDHEMRNFGGAYGLATFDERPIKGAVSTGEFPYVDFPNAP